MSKLVLTQIDNIATSADDLNANFVAIEAAFENTVSRDGTTPNHLTAPLDMNSQSIQNLPLASQNGQAVPYQQLGVSVSGGSMSPFGATLQDFGAKTTQAAGASFDSSAAVQAAFDYFGIYGTGRTGTLFSPQGSYRISEQLKMRIGTNFVGENNGAASIFVFYNDDDLIPFVIDGINGHNSWAYQNTIENTYFYFGHVTGTALRHFDITSAYSCHLRNIILAGEETTQTPLGISKVNDISLEGLVITTSVANTTQLVLVDSTAGDINKVRFVRPDLEVGVKGIKFTGANRLVAEVNSIYTEGLTNSIYWDASQSESSLFVNGGEILGSGTNAIGVDIRRSNCTVLGLNMCNAGLIGVDIDNATTHDNCHVIGGHLNVATPVRDTNTWLVTNTFA